MLHLNSEGYERGKHRPPHIGLARIAVAAGLLSSPLSALAQEQRSDQAPPAEAGPVQQSDDWDVMLGAGVVLGPDYEGSDSLEAIALPIVDINWRDVVFLDARRGFGANVLHTEQLRIGISVGYARGRDEDDHEHLDGLGDIDPAARGHVFGSYDFGSVELFADLSQDFGGSDGRQIEAGATLTRPIGKALAFSASLSSTWSDDNYMQAFYGVSEAQATRSGLPAHSAGSGLKSADLRIGAAWRASERWVYSANLGAGYLLGDASDSPVTEDRVQPFFGLMAGYRY